MLAGAAGGDNTLLNSILFSGLDDGTYTVKEVGEPGWVLTGISCDGDDDSRLLIGGDVGFDPGDDTVVIALSASEDIVCTFTNTELGSIKCNKHAQPDDAQDFACG